MTEERESLGVVHQESRCGDAGTGEGRTGDGGYRQLVEQIQDWRTEEMTCDSGSRVVANIALTGLLSKNGYRYTERALRDAVGLYENRPVFLDHASKLAQPFDRSTRDLVGTVVRARFENGRIRGDVQTLNTEAGRTFLALAESRSAVIGMSHVVLVNRGPDPTVVEKIQQVVSVDAVVFPATEATFREQQHGALSEGNESGESAARGEVVQVEDDRAGVAAEANRSELCVLREKLTEVLCEREMLREKVEVLDSALRELRRDQRVEELVRQSGLPREAVTDVFRQQLRETDDVSRQRLLIEDRLALFGQARSVVPTSRERRSPLSQVAQDERVFIAAIKSPTRLGLAGIS